MKYVNITDIIKLYPDKVAGEAYIKYLLCDQFYQYKHMEIYSLKCLIENLNLDYYCYSNFIYSYNVPHLNKEFDLIKIFDNSVVNIELKSQKVDENKIIKQLKQNRYFLKMIKPHVIQYCYISSDNKLLKYENDLLEPVDIYELQMLLTLEKSIEIDLDDIFSPTNILVSPLNNTLDFVEQKYLLTDDQSEKKQAAINAFESGARYVSIIGGAGVGKTLVTYDLARELSKKYKILIIHCGILCNGHNLLNTILDNIDIIPAKEFLQTIEFSDFQYDYVFLDEAQRFYKSSLDKLIEYTNCHDIKCLFSFDEKQRVSNYEVDSQTVEKINEICANTIFKLSKSVRVNKELTMFIAGLFDLKKIPEGIRYDNVKIIYESNQDKAVSIARQLEKEGYTYISYTPSSVYSKLDYQKSENNTHNVIGQEFNKVCMILDSYFYYEDGKLKSRPHPNPDYIFSKLLYQGLTRARESIILIVRDVELLKIVLSIVNH